MSTYKVKKDLAGNQKRIFWFYEKGLDLREAREGWTLATEVAQTARPPIGKRVMTTTKLALFYSGGHAQIIII